jgi:hypothetical protein
MVVLIDPCSPLLSSLDGLILIVNYCTFINNLTMILLRIGSNIFSVGRAFSFSRI